MQLCLICSARVRKSWLVLLNMRFRCLSRRGLCSQAWLALTKIRQQSQFAFPISLAQKLLVLWRLQVTPRIFVRWVQASVSARSMFWNSTFVQLQFSQSFRSLPKKQLRIGKIDVCRAAVEFVPLIKRVDPPKASREAVWYLSPFFLSATQVHLGVSNYEMRAKATKRTPQRIMNATAGLVYLPSALTLSWTLA